MKNFQEFLQKVLILFQDRCSRLLCLFYARHHHSCNWPRNWTQWIWQNFFHVKVSTLRNNGHHPKKVLACFQHDFLIFATIFSDFNVLKDFNFIFGKISKNFIVLSPESLFVIKSTNFGSQYISYHIFFGGSSRGKLHRSNASLVNGLNQMFWSTSIRNSTSSLSFVILDDVKSECQRPCLLLSTMYLSCVMQDAL